MQPLAERPKTAYTERTPADPLRTFMLQQRDTHLALARQHMKLVREIEKACGLAPAKQERER